MSGIYHRREFLFLLAIGGSAVACSREKKPAIMKVLYGRVIDEKGNGVAQATVTLKSLSSQATRVVTTKDDGRYRFTDLKPTEDYVVQAEYENLTSRARIAGSSNTTSRRVLKLYSSPPVEAITIKNIPKKYYPEVIKQTIVDQFDVEESEVTATAHFVDDLGADFLATEELMKSFEKIFAVEIPDEDAERIWTLKDAIDYIRAHAEVKELTSSAISVWKGVRQAGRVRWWNRSKGYGLIGQEDGTDVFVHYSAIQGEGYKTLQEGDLVEYEVVQGPKGLLADKVVKL